MKRTILSIFALVICTVLILSTVACDRTADTTGTEPAKTTDAAGTSSSTPTSSATPDSFKISSEKLMLFVKESTVLQSNDEKNTKWRSDNSDVVKIDEKGNVYALKKGSAVITAENADGEAIQCKVTVYDPSDYVKLSDIKSITLKQEQIDKEIEKEYEYMSEYFAERKAAEEGRLIEKNDIASISFSGVLEGETEPFEGGTGVYDLGIGSGSFIGGFEDGLIGHKAGETVILNLTFPENYVDPSKDPERAEKFNGKKVVFTVQISKVYLMIPAEITDDLVAKATNGQYKTIAEYTEYLSKQLREYLSLEEVISACEITSYPDELVNYYNEVWINNKFGMYAQYYGMTAVEFACKYYGYTEDELYETATNNSKAYIEQLYVVYSVIGGEDFSVSPQDRDRILSDYATSGGFESVDELIKEAGEGYIDNYVANEYAIELIVSWIDISEAEDDIST